MNRPKVIYFLIIFLIGCSESRRTTRNESSYNTNEITTESKIFDFGQVSNSEVDSISFSFTLRNGGKEDVLIKEIEATCPCVVISDKPKKVPFYNSSTIRGKMSIKEAYGKQNKAVFVNYGDNNILLLRIVGEITKEANN